MSMQQAPNVNKNSKNIAVYCPNHAENIGY